MTVYLSGSRSIFHEPRRPNDRQRAVPVVRSLAAISMVLGAWSSADDSIVDVAVSAFSRAPSFEFASLSPDGTFLAFVEQSADRQAIVVRKLGDGSDRRVLELVSARERVRWCDWAGDRHLLCGTVGPVRGRARITEETRLYAIETREARVRELNSRLNDPQRDRIVDFLGHRTPRVLIQYDEVGRGFPVVAELDATSGALRQVVSSRPPIRRWLGDGSGRVRLGIGYEDGVGSLWLPPPHGSEDWRKLIERPITDVETIAPLSFGASPDELYALKHHEGRTALVRMDLSRFEPTSTLLYSSPRYDISGPVVLEPATRRLLAIRYLGERETQHVFDEAEASRQRWLDERMPGRVNRVLARTRDGERQLVQSASDIDPPSLYLYDVKTERVDLIGHRYPELENVQLAPMQPTSYRARDGQTIPAYLTIPDAARGTPGPAVVLPHGGPESRNLHGFDALVQFLAAQGYVVLQMNFRGSLGYGAPFAALGAGQWGGVIHNDITDGARWLVEQQIADPTRICIVGLSFGGYAALLAATREAQWYACAASYAGISDLMALSEYGRRVQNDGIWQERLGADPRALWQMSPMARVRNVEIPTLIVHGREDPVVPFTQSRRFARALRGAGKSHRHLERMDCDHDMTIESCRDAFYFELRRFLDATLGADTAN